LYLGDNLTPRTTKEGWHESHEKILDSAETLFAINGFNGTSMNDIVKESNISKGAIYSHFESKEKLFLALWERQTRIGIEQLKTMFSPDDSAADKLVKVADMTVSSSCDCPRGVGRMLLEFMVSASRVEALEPDLQNRYSTIHAFIVEIFEEGIRNGEFKPNIDPKILTSILFAALDGLTLHWATLGIKFETKKIQETLMEVVFRGILI
jgi:AcrR family transcriptional regulator